MTTRTPRRQVGTTFQFKATSGGSYATITGVMKFKLPKPKSGTEDLTPVEGPVEIEGNTIVGYTDLELELTFDQEDTVHRAMQTAVGSTVDAYVKATTVSGRTIEYIGNVKEIAPTDGTAKNYDRLTWKMHPNAAPTEVAPT